MHKVRRACLWRPSDLLFNNTGRKVVTTVVKMSLDSRGRVPRIGEIRRTLAHFSHAQLLTSRATRLACIWLKGTNNPVRMIAILDY